MPVPVITVEKSEEKDARKPPEFWGERHTFVLMAFLGYTLCFTLRVDLAVAIVAMVNTTSTTDGAEPPDQCPPVGERRSANGRELESGYAEFDWTIKEQGLVLSGFSLGYVMTMVLGSYLDARYGGKWVLGFSALGTGLISLVIPAVAKINPGNAWPVFFARVVEGAFQGPVLPAIFSMAAKWIPRTEKTALLGVISAGGNLGPVTGMLLSGYLTSAFGWEVVFYTLGSAVIVWFAFYIFLVYGEPAHHPRISQAEKLYIAANIDVKKPNREKMPPLPVKKVLTSAPVWAALCGLVGFAWLAFNAMTLTPTYLDRIQNVSVDINGYLSAVPYMVIFMMIFPVSWGAQELVNRRILTLQLQRKLFNTVGSYGSAAALVWLAFVECNVTEAVTAISIAVGLLAFVTPGVWLSISDIAPNYTGSLIAIINTAGNAMGFLTPIVTSAIVDANPTFEGWRTAYLLAAGVTATGATIFLVFGDTKIQEWNFPPKSDQVDLNYRRLSNISTRELKAVELSPHDQLKAE